MRISDWSSDVCSSDLKDVGPRQKADDEIGGGDLKSLTEQFYPRADRLERSKQGHLFGFHAQRHDANGWMMRIIRGSITILKSEQGHSRSEEHTSELQSLMRISYAVFCLKKKKKDTTKYTNTNT